MQIYVAGRTDNIEQVRFVQKSCRVAGHGITHDWTEIVEEVGGAARDDIVTPEKQRGFAEKDLEGVRTCDLLIMVASPKLTGTLIETGAALAWGKPVWVLGEPERHSVFFHLPGVTKILSMQELNRELLLQPQGDYK